MHKLKLCIISHITTTAKATFQISSRCCSLHIIEDSIYGVLLDSYRYELRIALVFIIKRYLGPADKDRHLFPLQSIAEPTRGNSLWTSLFYGLL